MSEQDQKTLEFGVIRRLLEHQAATAYGVDAARNLAPAADVAEALRFQYAVTAARRLLESGTPMDLAGTPDVRPALRQARTEGSVLPGTTLYHLVLLRDRGQRIAVWERTEPVLCGEATDLEPLEALVGDLRSAVLPNGQMKPEASLRLRALHANAEQLRMEIQTLLKTRLEAVKLPIRPDSLAWPGGRGALVLPHTSADAVKGVRRGTAATGRQVVVEPMEVVGPNNRLEVLTGQLEAEQTLLRRQFTDRIREVLPLWRALVTVLAWVDLAIAAARISIQFNASPPTLVEEPILVLDRAYHPGLLVQFASDTTGVPPVALSLTIDEERRMVIITGPNTGGKTVVLKTVGLLVLMARCGLHIPAEGLCTVGLFHKLVVGIGDNQSLYHHLSTFAGHVETLKRLMTEADERTLVLIDELGTGTDPEEGAALAMAVLDELSLRRVPGLITTHLPPLKTYERAGIVRACMEFDESRLAPTYRLLFGAAGASHGLTIAGRNGLPAALIARARGYLKQAVTDASAP